MRRAHSRRAMVTPLNTERTHAGSVLKNKEYFQSLSERQTPKGCLGASVVVHVALLSILLLFPLLSPQSLHLNYQTTLLAPPPPKPSVTHQPLELKLAPKLVPPRPVVKTEAIVATLPPPPP